MDPASLVGKHELFILLTARVGVERRFFSIGCFSTGNRSESLVFLADVADTFFLDTCAVRNVIFVSGTAVLFEIETLVFNDANSVFLGIDVFM